MLTDDYITTYTDLLQSFARGEAAESKEFCAFAPLRGKDWQKGDVIFYGRALNQWPGVFTRADVAEEKGSRRFAGEVCRLGRNKSICESDKDALCWSAPYSDACKDSQMHWVHHRRQTKEWRYSSVAAGCPFWRVVGKVVRQYYKLDSASEEWASRVAWSNLYKIAPKCGGNPNEGEKRSQLEVCKELLEKELTLWKPKAAVFLTETKKRSAKFVFEEIDNDWFGKFRSRFTSIRLCPRKRDGGPLVHGGTAKIGNEEVRVIVALRPESLPHDELCEEILGALRD